MVAIDPAATHFTAFGFRAPSCDADELRSRHRELSRKLHPDLYMTAADEERRASVINVSALNDAYRCLSNPLARAAYWLELSGNPLGKDNSRVDPELAAELFEVQELAGDLRAAPAQSAEEAELARGAEEAHTRLQASLQEQIETAVEIMNDWPTAADPARAALDRLKQVASRASYLKTMTRNLKSVLDDTWQRSVA